MGQVYVARSRCAIHGHAYGALNNHWNVLDRLGSSCVLADRLCTSNLIDLLETASALERRVARTTQAYHWTFIDESFSHSADRVCHARSTYSEYHSRAFGEVAYDSRSVRRSLLISESKVIHILTLAC